MSVTNQSPLLQSLQLQEELRTAVDERTLQILDRRRRTAVVKRRGWLVRRMLLLADVVGLVGALLVAQWLAPADRQRRRLLAASWRSSPSCHHSGMGGDHEALRPLRPRRRARQPLDRRRLRRRLPHGHRLHVARYRGHVCERHRASDRAEARRLLGWRDHVRLYRPCWGAGACAPERGLCPEHRHRRCGRRRPVVREEGPQPPGVRDQSRRLRRHQAEGAPDRTWSTWRCSAIRADSPRSSACWMSSASSSPSRTTRMRRRSSCFGP